MTHRLLLPSLLVSTLLLAGCGAVPQRALAPAAVDGAGEGDVPAPRRAPRWRGRISDERPPWLRDLPERIERYRAPEDSTRAGLPRLRIAAPIRRSADPSG